MALTVIKPSGIDTSGNYTVTGMNVSANATVANLSVTTSLTLLTNSANLGPVGNVIITGGTNGYVLQTDGAGNLSWVAQSGGGSTSNISNGNSNVNIPSSNGNINLTAVGNTTMVITGTGVNVAGTLNISGNTTVGNLVTSGSGGTLSNINVVSANTFTASGNITAGNASLGNSVVANYFTGNLYGTANLAIYATTANSVAGANVSGQVANALVAGTVYTNAQPNITSVGTLTDVSVSGNGVFGGNLTVNGTLTYINSTTLSISDPIINLQTGPNGAAPVANTGKDVGTALNYYDTSAKIAWMGWDVSNAEIAFGSNVSISSEVVTFTSLANIRSGNAQLGNNVSANFFTGNGVYLTGITTTGISNGNSNINIPSSNGNVNISAVGNANVLVITGTGINVAGTLNATGNASLGNLVTSGSGGNIANANVISANTFTATGNITGAYILGNGSQLTGIVSSAASISNGNSNVNIPSANGNVTISAVGNANILVVTGTGVNVAGTLNATGNASLGNLVTTGSGGNISNANVISANTFTASGNITSANANLGNVVIANFFTGNGIYLTGITTAGLSNGNSNVNIPAANGNVNISAVGNANVVVVTGTGANIKGTFAVSTYTRNASVSNPQSYFGSDVALNPAMVIQHMSPTAYSTIDFWSSANTYLGAIGGANPNATSVPVGNAMTIYSGTASNNGIALYAVTGNISISPNSNSNIFVVTGTGANIAGTLNITGNANLGNIGATNGVFTNVSGNGSALTSITGANVTGAVSFATTANSVAGGNVSGQVANSLIAGTVYTNAQPNITSVGTLTSLDVTGNITSGNANLGNLVTANFFTGNGTQLSSLTFGNITTFSTANLTTDELYLQAITRLNVTASGASGYLFDQYGATLNPALYVNSGQTLAFNLNVSGHPFLIQTSGGANYSVGLEHVTTTGTVSTTTSAQGQIAGTLYWKVPYGIVGNYKYQCSIHGGMNGNIVVTDSNVANITVGLATFATTANAVAGGNVSGQVANALIAGTVYTNAQPNITSVGSLTGLTVSNATGVVDFTTTANVTLGVVGNLHISGGTNAYVLSTDGSGNLSWVAQSGGGGGGANISNGNSNVNIPSANGNINFSAVGNANVVVITGTGANISGTANITGNVALSGANVTLGSVANLHISGGSNTYVLSTDGSGNLTWAAASGTSIGVDNFTGNGVETAYTLTSTPSNANATLVSIAGTFQPRTVYSVAGNVITFSSAPPNTAPIEITTFTAGNGGGGGGITAQDLLSPFLLMGA